MRRCPSRPKQALLPAELTPIPPRAAPAPALRVCPRGRWRQESPRAAPGRIFEDHAMRHLQRLPVLVRDEAGPHQEAVERPQRHRERQQRRGPAGSACGRDLSVTCPSPVRHRPSSRRPYRRLAARRLPRGRGTAPTAACAAAWPPSAGAGLQRPGSACATSRRRGHGWHFSSGRSSEREASALWSPVFQVRGAASGTVLLGAAERSTRGAGSAERSARVPAPPSPPGRGGAAGERPRPLTRVSVGAGAAAPPAGMGRLPLPHVAVAVALGVLSGLYIYRPLFSPAGPRQPPQGSAEPPAVAAPEKRP